MSAQQTPSNLLSQQVAFWDDVTTELNGSRTRRDVPDMPTISVDYQVIKTPGIEGLAYLMLQIQKTQDRAVVIRALASACSILFNDKKNFLGCRTQAVDLKGLEIAENDSTDRGKEIPTNFEDEELITVGELLDTMEADADEVGAYFGVLFLAGNKKVTTDNRPAFNEKRQQAATASLIGPAKIFVPNSPFLTDEILGKIYATFTSLQPLRAHLVSNVVAKLQQPHMGPSLAFTNMFLLLTDSGMNALKIIKEAVVKHPWIRKKFPELRPEFAAANEAQQVIRKGPVQSRPFLKAVHGNTFVPVDYKTIENLTGVCKEVLRRTTPSYNNYGGGKVSEHQLATINAMIETPDRGTGDALVSE